MWSRNILLVSLFVIVTATRQFIRERSNEDGDDDVFHIKKRTDSRVPTTTGRSSVGDAVVEKFVETLMSSERYLKMIESVERKMNHLDTTFHERTNSILKYLSEMLRMIKASSSEMLEKALRNVKSDLDKLKQSMSERIDEHPNMRAEGADYHIDSTLDTRLTFLENHMKSIQTGVDSIVATISEVKSRQYTRTFAKSDVTGTVDTMSLINEFRKTLREQKNKKCECKSNRVDRSERYPTDCHEIQVQGFNVSGIYKIRPEDMEPFYVLCDLTTAGGGWTVFQNRFDGSQDFYKGWSDYEYGFGNLAGEFWLGLEKLNYLTNQKLYELRIEMETQHGQDAYAGYSVFTVGPEHEGYRISTLGTFYGTAGDSLSYHAGQKFSTLDVDNDEWKEGACATEHGGAWWYKECDKSNLNGKYSMTTEDNRGQSMYWISFKGPNFPLTKTKMMIRPLPASKPIDYMDTNRKILEGPELRPPVDKVRPIPDKLPGLRTNNVKGTYDLSPSHSQYRYDEPTADAFFPNYA
ncbi:fibrinogen C domain-containing protein 1-like isoform X5 [Trichoplusia ni]|uniref:Fibrinogen C domain-containing protein 1-like isoform X5 n=1 Tax=Trichoplusia ni TaxID=7111 RepID=A0A7E5X0C9_TRINI|nr:fibrinogen C domain-containing protein 1-like isoform X5 [Trichoplusia ni]